MRGSLTRSSSSSANNNSNNSSSSRGRPSSFNFASTRSLYENPAPASFPSDSEDDLHQLLRDIQRVSDGDTRVTFGELFDDPQVEQHYEALVGTLLQAKRRNLVAFTGQMLLKGPHDNVVISIIPSALSTTSLRADRTTAGKISPAASSDSGSGAGPNTQPAGTDKASPIPSPSRSVQVIGSNVHRADSEEAVDIVVDVDVENDPKEQIGGINSIRAGDIEPGTEQHGEDASVPSLAGTQTTTSKQSHGDGASLDASNSSMPEMPDDRSKNADDPALHISLPSDEGEAMDGILSPYSSDGTSPQVDGSSSHSAKHAGNSMPDSDNSTPTTPSDGGQRGSRSVINESVENLSNDTQEPDNVTEVPRQTNDTEEDDTRSASDDSKPEDEPRGKFFYRSPKRDKDLKGRMSFLAAIPALKRKHSNEEEPAIESTPKTTNERGSVQEREASPPIGEIDDDIMEPHPTYEGDMPLKRSESSSSLNQDDIFQPNAKDAASPSSSRSNLGMSVRMRLKEYGELRKSLARKNSNDSKLKRRGKSSGLDSNSSSMHSVSRPTSLLSLTISLDDDDYDDKGRKESNVPAQDDEQGSNSMPSPRNSNRTPSLKGVAALDTEDIDTSKGTLTDAVDEDGQHGDERQIGSNTSQTKKQDGGNVIAPNASPAASHSTPMLRNNQTDDVESIAVETDADDVDVDSENGNGQMIISAAQEVIETSEETPSPRSESQADQQISSGTSITDGDIDVRSGLDAVDEASAENIQLDEALSHDKGFSSTAKDRSADEDSKHTTEGRERNSGDASTQDVHMLSRDPETSVRVSDSDEALTLGMGPVGQSRPHEGGSVEEPLNNGDEMLEFAKQKMNDDPSAEDEDGSKLLGDVHTLGLHEDFPDTVMKGDDRASTLEEDANEETGDRPDLTTLERADEDAASEQKYHVVEPAGMAQNTLQGNKELSQPAFEHLEQQKAPLVETVAEEPEASSSSRGIPTNISLSEYRPVSKLDLDSSTSTMEKMLDGADIEQCAKEGGSIQPIILPDAHTGSSHSNNSWMPPPGDQLELYDKDEEDRLRRKDSWSSNKEKITRIDFAGFVRSDSKVFKWMPPEGQEEKGDTVVEPDAEPNNSDGSRDSDEKNAVPLASASSSDSHSDESSESEGAAMVSGRFDDRLEDVIEGDEEDETGTEDGENQDVAAGLPGVAPRDALHLLEISDNRLLIAEASDGSSTSDGQEDDEQQSTNHDNNKQQQQQEEEEEEEDRDDGGAFEPGATPALPADDARCFGPEKAAETTGPQGGYDTNRSVPDQNTQQDGRNAFDDIELGAAGAVEENGTRTIDLEASDGSDGSNKAKSADLGDASTNDGSGSRQRRLIALACCCGLLIGAGVALAIYILLIEDDDSNGSNPGLRAVISTPPTQAPTASPTSPTLTDSPVTLPTSIGTTAQPTLSPVIESTDPPTATIASTETPSQSPSLSDASSETISRLIEFIATAFPPGTAALEDTTSPQYQALLFIFNRVPNNAGIFSDQRYLQRYALASLYFSTGGSQWRNDDDWLTNVTECQWYSSSQSIALCDGDGRLIELDLTDNNLRGTIPIELAMLSDSLQVLRLTRNRLVGTIPPLVLEASANLVELALDENLLRGEIPATIGQAQNLEILDVGYNGLNGTLPSEIGSLGSLTRLVVTENDITGIIPGELSNLQGMETLLIDRTSLLAPLPDALCDNLVNLADFWSDCDELGGCACCTVCCADENVCLPV
mmetsp:Transcript_28035/g.78619  ORF Transcript_28035/g.78619 Transcript_28035/m.78619 type:complete len:1735 (+) Transcript_28035:155-5359(+)